MTWRLRSECLGALVALLSIAPVPARAQPAVADAPAAKPAAIATGEIGGTYTALADSLRRTLAGTGPALSLRMTSGSLENLEATARREVELGLVQLDLLTFLKGIPAYEPVLRQVRLVAPLYLEEVHIVVRVAAGISRPEDLAGKRVNIGPQKSGSSFSAHVLLKHHGLEEKDVVLDYRPTSDAVVALLAGTLDAAFLTAGQPVRYLRELGADASSKIALLSLGKDKAMRYQRSRLPYHAATFAPGAYPWLKEAVHTVATPCVLIAHVDADPVVVGAVAKVVFTQRQALAALHPKWSQVDFETAKAIVAANHLPLHPGAAPYAAPPAAP